MNKAFDMIIHDSSNDGFTGVNTHTIIVSQNLCKKLEDMVNKNELNYEHVRKQ
jgi:hypothetical protein